MKYIINDEKQHFISVFDTQTGAHIRTGILDADENDKGVDPFMASFPKWICPQKHLDAHIFDEHIFG